MDHLLSHSAQLSPIPTDFTIMHTVLILVPVFLAGWVSLNIVRTPDRQNIPRSAPPSKKVNVLKKNKKMRQKNKKKDY